MSLAGFGGDDSGDEWSDDEGGGSRPAPPKASPPGPPKKPGVPAKAGQAVPPKPASRPTGPAKSYKDPMLDDDSEEEKTSLRAPAAVPPHMRGGPPVIASAVASSGKAGVSYRDPMLDESSEEEAPRPAHKVKVAAPPKPAAAAPAVAKGVFGAGGRMGTFRDPMLDDGDDEEEEKEAPKPAADKSAPQKSAHNAMKRPSNTPAPAPAVPTTLAKGVFGAGSTFKDPMLDSEEEEDEAAKKPASTTSGPTYYDDAYNIRSEEDEEIERMLREQQQQQQKQPSHASNPVSTRGIIKSGKVESNSDSEEEENKEADRLKPAPAPAPAPKQQQAHAGIHRPSMEVHVGGTLHAAEKPHFSGAHGAIRTEQPAPAAAPMHHHADQHNNTNRRGSAFHPDEPRQSVHVDHSISQPASVWPARRDSIARTAPADASKASSTAGSTGGSLSSRQEAPPVSAATAALFNSPYIATPQPISTTAPASVPAPAPAAQRPIASAAAFSASTSALLANLGQGAPEPAPKPKVASATMWKPFASAASATSTAMVTVVPALPRATEETAAIENLLETLSVAPSVARTTASVPLPVQPSASPVVAESTSASARDLESSVSRILEKRRARTGGKTGPPAPASSAASFLLPPRALSEGPSREASPVRSEYYSQSRSSSPLPSSRPTTPFTAPELPPVPVAAATNGAMPNTATMQQLLVLQDRYRHLQLQREALAKKLAYKQEPRNGSHLPLEDLAPAPAPVPVYSAPVFASTSPQRSAIRPPPPAPTPRAVRQQAGIASTMNTLKEAEQHMASTDALLQDVLHGRQHDDVSAAAGRLGVDVSSLTNEEAAVLRSLMSKSSAVGSAGSAPASYAPMTNGHAGTAGLTNGVERSGGNAILRWNSLPVLTESGELLPQSPAALRVKQDVRAAMGGFAVDILAYTAQLAFVDNPSFPSASPRASAQHEGVALQSGKLVNFVPLGASTRVLQALSCLPHGTSTSLSQRSFEYVGRLPLHAAAGQPYSRMRMTDALVLDTRFSTVLRVTPDAHGIGWYSKQDPANELSIGELPIFGVCGMTAEGEEVLSMACQIAVPLTFARRNTSGTPASTAPLARALADLPPPDGDATHAVAIINLVARFPGAHSRDQFVTAVSFLRSCIPAPVHALTSIPVERWESDDMTYEREHAGEVAEITQHLMSLSPPRPSSPRAVSPTPTTARGYSGLASSFVQSDAPPALTIEHLTSPTGGMGISVSRPNLSSSESAAQRQLASAMAYTTVPSRAGGPGGAPQFTNLHTTSYASQGLNRSLPKRTPIVRNDARALNVSLSTLPSSRAYNTGTTATTASGSPFAIAPPPQLGARGYAR
jgi:hypothetical protein